MLRCDLFPTLPRKETRIIAIRDSIEPPDMDIHKLDTLHCKRGRLGLGWHFLVLTDGTIQLGRHHSTCGSHTRNKDDISVAIGVVGGKLEDGTRANTRTLEQLSAISDLVNVLREFYPDAEQHDAPQS